MDRLSGLIVFLIGATILLEGRQLPMGSFRAAGPGLFPFMLGMIMISLSLFLIIPRGEKERDGKSFSSGSTSLRRIVPVYAALLAYFFFLKYVGFIVIAVLLMVFLFLKVASLKWYSALLGALVSTGLAYFIFEVLLESRLPRGVLGF